MESEKMMVGCAKRALKYVPERKRSKRKFECNSEHVF